MFNFNLRGTAISAAIRWEKFILFRFAAFLKKCLLILFIFFLLLFLYGVSQERFSENTQRSFLGFSIFCISLSVSFYLLHAFLEQKLKKPKIKISLSEAVLSAEKYNLAEFLSFEAAKATSQSVKSARSFFGGTGEITSSRLFYFLLAEKNKITNFIFQRALLDKEEIKTRLKEAMKGSKKEDGQVFSDDFQKTILSALKISQGHKDPVITGADLFFALAKENRIFQEILVQRSLTPEDIGNLVVWAENVEKEIAGIKRFWSEDNLAKNGTLAKTWTAGYTINLDKYSHDLTDTVKGSTPEFVAHKEQIGVVERILSRREKNNVLIVGDSGSGRRSIVYGLAQKSLLGKSLAEVNYKRVVEMDMAALISQIENKDELELTLDTIFREVLSAGNIILVIDEFHNYIGQVAKPGIVDISGILSPYLNLPQFQIIAITDYEGLHRNVEKNPSALSLFEKVEVSPVSVEDALSVLETLVPILEQKYKIFISYPAIRDIVHLTDKYMPALFFPEKAIKTLDELAVYVATSSKNKIVLPQDVAKIITEKTEIPVGDIDTKEREVLLNLESLIHKRIVNQEEAVKDIATALRRARSGVTIRKGPMGAFLFLGPTGVGKTETSKALAESYFGAEKKMIRLDMSEFQDIKDISRIIGSLSTPGILTTAVRENPFSLVLLDEFEKADSSVLNLFLQVFDEGYLNDNFGKKVDFKNTMLIATSNAGYKIILDALKEKTAWDGVKQKLLDYLFEKGTFRPELINRFDAVVVFKPLDQKNLISIAELMLLNLKKNLWEKGIEFVITEPLKEKIAELGYNPVFGAREMRRVVQEKIENVFAFALLNKKIKRGQKVAINPKDFTLIPMA